MGALLWTVGLLAASGFLFWRRRRNACSRNARMPPGPPGKFFVGNALDVPTQAPWVWYRGLKEKYGKSLSYLLFRLGKLWLVDGVRALGDVSRIDIMGNNFILLNSSKSINDLFGKRGANFSDRPRMTLGGEM